MADLIAEHLARSFGRGSQRTAVLHDVSVELDRREFALLMGPSGSGKSTLLALLSGLARPDSGRVVALGEDIWNLGERRREEFRLRHCGFIFQSANLFPTLTAREQLEMVLRWSGVAAAREARRRVDATLDRLGLAGKGDLFPGQLSGGEQQRVAVARALVKRPALCFGDEPTAALDWATGRPVVELLREVARADNTLMFVVAHDPRLIPFADRLLHIVDGRLTESTSETATALAGEAT